MGGVRLDGDVDRLIKELKRLEHANLKVPSKALAQSLKTSTRERFQTQKSPDGQSWKASVRAVEKGGVTLTDTAILKNSIRSKSSEKGFAVGTDLKYAATHQYGDSRTIRAKSNKGLRFKVNGRWVTKKKVKVTIPARPYLGISEDDIREIKGTLEDFIGGDS